MIKVFGNPMSTCTRKVIMTAKETGTPYELQTIDFGKGEHKQSEHMSRQPFGQVPTIDDGGFTLYESRAICRYINEKAGGKLIPTDLKSRALMEQWISIETSNFTPHAMKFIYHHVFQRAQTPETMEAATKGLETAVKTMDQALVKSTYLAGSDFSLADICFMPYIDYAMNSPAKDIFTRNTHFASWWGRISERATWMEIARK